MLMLTDPNSERAAIVAYMRVRANEMRRGASEVESHVGHHNSSLYQQAETLESMALEIEQRKHLRGGEAP